MELFQPGDKLGFRVFVVRFGVPVHVGKNCIIELVVEVEEEEQHQALLVQESDSL